MNESRIGVIADVHANLQALNAVLADAVGRGAGKFICLGDVVGYGPQPQACVDRLRELNIATVQGNHDAWASSSGDLARLELAPTVDLGIEHARRQLTARSKQWLRRLPSIAKTSDWAATHASFHQPQSWTYVGSHQAAGESFGGLKTRVGFSGHTHRAGYWFERGADWRSLAIGREVRLAAEDRYLINPGSVGNPRTPANAPDPRAQYLIFDRSRMSVTFVRVAYDIAACVAEMRRAGLSEEMISRIELGY